ncbi:MAG: hypothetical protein HY046_13235, partial [Acidobacteria bacterium]|nr:hypothetical protein [Acidobacteriota bacterium]
QVPDEPEQPRVLLVSVPYALKASDADTLGGRPATEYLLRSQLGTSLLATPELAQSAGLTRAPATGGQVVDCTTNCTTNALSKFSSATTLTASLFSDNGTRITAGGGIDFSSDFSFVGNAAPAATGRVQLFDKAFQGFVIRGLNIIFETLQPAATEVLRITQSGNVGIGTATPSAPLEVAGTLKLSGANPAIVFTNGTTITPTQNASTQTHGIVYLAGCDSCSPLAPNDGQRNIYTNVVGTMTIQQVTCFSDTAAPGPIINLQRDSGTQANILSADLTCSTTGAIAPLLVGAQSILNVNDKIDFVMVTPGGTAKRATVVIKATLN